MQLYRTKLLPQLTNSIPNLKAQVIIVLFMALPSPQSASQVPETKEDFDLLKCSKIENGKKEAEVNLPTGYRFDPADDEIVVFYLFNKILDRELPITDVIKEISVYDHDPDELPNGDFKHGCDCNEAFYFTYTDQIYSSRGKITRRTTKSGYWDLDGEEEVKYGNGDITVGFEKVMVFHKGHSPNGIETDFIMHEFRLNPLVVPTHVLNDSIRAKIERYVVCRIIHEGISNYQPTFQLPPWTATPV